MAGNHVLLETIELTASAASVTFDNIPQSGYTDLKIVGSVRSDYSGQAIALRINPNGSTANMTGRVLLGSGSAASSFTDTIAYASAVADTSTANTYNNVEWYIPNYTSSNNKSISVDFVTETNATAAIMGLSAGLWSSSSAITSLVIATTAGNLMAYSTFSLYGVADVNTTPATAPKATGGNMVSTDGTYWYHTFLTSGNFVPQTDLTCDYLVIAGGGSGAGVSDACGGGGAGGLLSSVGSSGGGGAAGSALSLTATSYPIAIGAGGASYSGPDSWGISGSNSTFSSITAIGGGGGGKPYTNNGLNGGSGGGQGWGDGSPGSGTTGQGYAGGVSAGSGYGYSAGGGGGAGSTGYSASTSNGGNGLANSITGTSVTYAGGGGGGRSSSIGTGGSGGGGNGGNPTTKPTAGTANTGSGGGGSRTDAGQNQYGPSGAGGSGIVIIRYAMA